MGREEKKEGEGKSEGEKEGRMVVDSGGSFSSYSERERD